ncbi:transposase [Mesorhizobium sp. M1217]|uniref:IS4/Tn5 family transposase DNA-binding protein n=1 Tax=Mesorhizobium sp. M1217 TaxID=2957070 RepID=UPI003338252E
MRDKTSSSEAAWQEELCAAALPDKRLVRRLQRLPDQLSAAPGKPIPAACGDWAAAKAAYRFFDNPACDRTQRSRRPFRRDCGARCGERRSDPYPAEHDRVIYSRAQPGKIGLTKIINAGRYKAGQPNVLTLCGMLMHFEPGRHPHRHTPRSDGSEVSG